MHPTNQQDPSTNSGKFVLIVHEMRKRGIRLILFSCLVNSVSKLSKVNQLHHAPSILKVDRVNSSPYLPIHLVPRIDRHRRKALKLLILLIMDFLICWSPLYIYHTLGTFNKTFYHLVPSVAVDLILLLSFASTLCNPMMYYFRSERYRSVLYADLNWLYRKTHRSRSTAHLHRLTKNPFISLVDSKRRSVERR